MYVTTVEATCTTDGYELYRCNEDNEEKRKTIPALGHSTTTTEKPGENNTIIKEESCTRCGKVINTEIIKKPDEQPDQTLDGDGGSGIGGNNEEIEFPAPQASLPELIAQLQFYKAQLLESEFELVTDNVVYKIGSRI